MPKYRLKPVINRIMSILRKEGLDIVKMKGDHIKINKKPPSSPLKRPIILVNEKRLSPAVIRNLLDTCEEIGIDINKFHGIF